MTGPSNLACLMQFEETLQGATAQKLFLQFISLILNCSKNVFFRFCNVIKSMIVYIDVKRVTASRCCWWQYDWDWCCYASINFDCRNNFVVCTGTRKEWIPLFIIVHECNGHSSRTKTKSILINNILQLIEIVSLWK